MRSPFERNGSWLHCTVPSFGRTWRAYYFEWTMFGICFGFGVPRLFKGKPSKRLTWWPPKR